MLTEGVRRSAVHDSLPDTPARPLEIRSRQQGAPQRLDRLTNDLAPFHLPFFHRMYMSAAPERRLLLSGSARACDEGEARR